jgi:hypothetical protein
MGVFVIRITFAKIRLQHAASGSFWRQSQFRDSATPLRAAEYGARNNVVGKVGNQEGFLMCQVKVSVDGPIDITSVMTLDTRGPWRQKGDSVRVLVKAVNVILVRE